MSGLVHRAHELEAGIGDERRAGIGHERDGVALGETRDQLRPRLGGVVIVVGRQRRRDAVVIDELAGDAGVLASDHVGGGQYLQRAQGGVAQVADRGCDNVKPAGERGRILRLTLKQVTAVCGCTALSPQRRSWEGRLGLPHRGESSHGRPA